MTSGRRRRVEDKAEENPKVDPKDDSNRIKDAPAEAGADVAPTCERSADAAAAIVREIEARERPGFAIRADSADAAASTSWPTMPA